MAKEQTARNRPEHARLRAPHIVPKPWGREVWYANETEYAGKILEITKGHALSLQKHERKTETMYLLSGSVWFHLNGHEFDWVAGSCLTIRPGDIHRLHAVEDSVVLEVRSPHLYEVIRIKVN